MIKRGKENSYINLKILLPNINFKEFCSISKPQSTALVSTLEDKSLGGVEFSLQPKYYWEIPPTLWMTDFQALTRMTSVHYYGAVVELL